MPQWSGYHVKTDGRAYFRLRVPKDLHPYFGTQWPQVNLGMQEGREAERMCARSERTLAEASVHAHHREAC